MLATITDLYGDGDRRAIWQRFLHKSRYYMTPISWQTLFLWETLEADGGGLRLNTNLYDDLYRKPVCSNKSRLPEPVSHNLNLGRSVTDSIRNNLINSTPRPWACIILSPSYIMTSFLFSLNLH